MVAINSSTLLATWQLVNCFNSSGELPKYLLFIEELNSQFTKMVTKPWFLDEHYFVDLNKGSEYIVTIRAVNQFNQSDESIMFESTPKANGTDPIPATTPTILTTEDALPIIIGGAVGGAVLAIICIGVIVIVVIIASCRR